ncbi:MAG TPA: hypothetical protein DHW78_00620 [Ruminococcaceae bacterium]|jgi:hypothetical protein|nr:hypothetical protein [Oscillospiraceae bacterium]HCM22817.1 hypothetical protein [Oscillospiraceae bacterium]
MTCAEVSEEINAYNRRKKQDRQEQAQFRAQMDYRLASMISIGYNNPKKFPKNLNDAYPDLFPNEGWKQSKSNFARYAEEFNYQREVKGRDG